MRFLVEMLDRVRLLCLASNGHRMHVRSQWCDLLELAVNLFPAVRHVLAVVDLHFGHLKKRSHRLKPVERCLLDGRRVMSSRRQVQRFHVHPFCHDLVVFALWMLLDFLAQAELPPCSMIL